MNEGKFVIDIQLTLNGFLTMKVISMYRRIQYKLIDWHPVVSLSFFAIQLLCHLKQTLYKTNVMFVYIICIYCVQPYRISTN